MAFEDYLKMKRKQEESKMEYREQAKALEEDALRA